MATPLEDEIRRRIETAGALTVADYMQLCLGHPAHGYYVTRDPLGQSGDFITAPEISQMFGELIGLWTATVWRMMGEPSAVNLVELGPGRGTMMADALRAAKVLPAFTQAIAVHLVETSPALRARQREALEGSSTPITWHDALASVPQAPAIYLANEFFDALPVHQAVRGREGWRERVVTLGEEGRLRFGLGADLPASAVPAALHAAPQGAIFEWRDQDTTRALAARVSHCGAALIIDYGHVCSATGDTFQAMRAHGFHDPLVAPGTADLTAHVDFEALGAAAAEAGAQMHGPVEQRLFLQRLGIVQRAALLRGKASPAQARDIETALDRLTDSAPSGMGRLFKVVALSAPPLGPLPGFDL
ncbi:MAG TPA: SAM-dependent methyltransferase [Xanthobacteraceae bacterium]|nr:SAM-dependent methyltransferase [Xanthobacteraceae bacterium]